MSEAFLITFREGIEAFLIIAIMVAYLMRTGRTAAIPYVYIGASGAVILSLFLGLFLVSLADNPLTEGILALIAGGLVATMTYHMMKAGKRLKTSIENKLEIHAQQTSLWGLIALSLFALLMITREGMEIVLFMSALTIENSAITLSIGAFFGVAAALTLGFLWIKYQNKINIGKFMQVTSIFLLLFCIQLFLYGIHELSEINALPFVDNYPIHIATEAFAHDGFFAQLLSYGLIAGPILWLSISWLYKRPENYHPSE